MIDINTKKLIRHYRRTKSRLALEILVRNHIPLIHKAIKDLPKNVIQYDDQISIANDILLKSIHKDFDLRRKIKFTTYLMNIIKFRVIDEIRRIKINRNYAPEFLEHNSTSDVSEEIEKKELKDKLISAIPKLPSTQQIIFGCKLQGMKNKEIAAQAMVSQSLISIESRNALSALKRMLMKNL
jgi:RNA polymerase sigma factor (sigma-70 family)